MTPRRTTWQLALLVLLPGCVTAPADVTDVTFEQHDVVIGPGDRRTVLTGFLHGRPRADLAVVDIDEHGGRHLHVFGFEDDAWTPTLDTTLRDDVWFVDVATIDGRDRLVLYGAGRLGLFDPRTGTEIALDDVACDFKPTRTDEVPHVDVSHDVNGDGRDDLVLPHRAGYWILLQQEHGTFADPVRIGRRDDMVRLYGADGYRYDPWTSGLVHEMDYDLDNRTDLVFWNEDHFEAHLQDARGRFAEQPVTFCADVAFDSDEVASLAAPSGIRARHFDQPVHGEMTGRVLQSLSDLDGDGMGDLMVFSLEGGGLWHMRSSCEVHFGTRAADGTGTTFSPEVGAAIHSKGIPFDMRTRDLNGDGQADMLFSTLRPGVFMLIGAFIARSVPLDLEFHRMDGGQFPSTPAATRRTGADFPPSGSSHDKGLFPVVLTGDFTGDGRDDLCMQKGRHKLLIYAGTPGPELFVQHPHTVALTMPYDEEFTWLADVDGDGRQDVVVHHPSEDEDHRVTVLLAR